MFAPLSGQLRGHLCSICPCGQLPFLPPLESTYVLQYKVLSTIHYAILELSWADLN